MNRFDPLCRGLPLVVLLAMVVGGGVVGCASTSDSERASSSPKQRPPLTPDKVTFYRTPPAKFDTIGTVKVPVTPDLNWDERGDATAGFAILKSKAAAVGANGVLLKIPDREYDRQVTAAYNGDWYTVALRGQPGAATAVAHAIFVYSTR
jgi:hypothetical protein